jgi:hypothetical protein
LSAHPWVLSVLIVGNLGENFGGAFLHHAGAGSLAFERTESTWNGQGTADSHESFHFERHPFICCPCCY